MKTDDQINYFKSLTPAKIRAERIGKWSDSDLLDVLQYFEEKKESERETAVSELILLSPEDSDLVLYETLYVELAEYYRWKNGFSAALRWLYAGLAYDEQRQPGLNRNNRYRDLAEIYLNAEEFDTGLAIFTRRLQIAPDDIWTYNILGLTLPRVGLDDLTVEALDRALLLKSHDNFEDLREQLEEIRQKSLEDANKFASRLDEIDPDVLAAFRAALQLPIPTKRDEDAPEPYLAPLDQLIELGAEQDEALDAEILAQGKVLAPDLIRMAFDEALWDMETAVSAHAIALLRQLRPRMPELHNLAFWLERANGDWRSLLTKRMGKIGSYTTSELEAIAADVNNHLYVRSSATNALVERSEKRPDHRERIIRFFRTLLTHPQAYEATEETFIGFLVCDIADMRAQELYDEVKQVFDEDRIDRMIIDFPQIHEKWGLSPLPQPEMRSDGLYLLLRCKACERKRIHFVQHVLVDNNTLEKQQKGLPVKYDAHIMDREIVCPKCQAVDQYELTTEGNMRLHFHNASPQDIMATFMENKPKKQRPNPYLSSFQAAAFGRPMHPLVALDTYRQKIKSKPNDAILHMRLGNMLRTLRRNAQALTAYRQAYELEPDHMEICLNRGMAEHDYGDRAAAKMLYEKVAGRVSPLQMLQRAGGSDMAVAAMEGLRNLKRRKSSPYATPLSGGEPVSSSKRKVSRRKQRKRKRRRR
ncbi:MAG: DUF1186 domain-containing protein [Chloroflexi bacterium]|nr:DUF1186 domain-containing protein [Chloroflexota bacterium]